MSHYLPEWFDRLMVWLGNSALVVAVLILAMVMAFGMWDRVLVALLQVVAVTVFRGLVLMRFGVSGFPEQSTEENS